MFTWICPQCGREVPPAYNECPDCANKPAGVPAPAQVVEEAREPEQEAAPRVVPQPASYATPGQPRPSLRIPEWMLSIVFALAFVGLGVGAYLGYQHLKTPARNGPPALGLENPPTAATGARPHPLLKYVEVVGVRLTQDSKRKTLAQFVVVNHSGAEIADLAADVNVRGRAGDQEQTPVGTFSFRIPTLRPYEAKELTAGLNTKLKIYEMPDWQNLTEEIRIKSPQ